MNARQRLSIFTLLCVLPTAALAESISEAAQRVNGIFPEMTSLALNIGVLVGLVLFIWGVYNFYAKEALSANASPRTTKVSIIMLVVGVLLMSMPWMISTGTETITGDQSTMVNDNIY